MAYTVKCRKCGATLNRDKAFRVVVGKVNTYYCNESEYNNVVLAKQVKENTYKCIDRIFGYKIVNTVLRKEINVLLENYSYELILSYLQSNFDFLHDVMRRSFQSEYAKIRYFSAILRNSLEDYKQSLNKIPETKVGELDIANMNFHRKTKRVALQDIEMDVGDES